MKETAGIGPDPLENTPSLPADIMTRLIHREFELVYFYALAELISQRQYTQPPPDGRKPGRLVHLSHRPSLGPPRSDRAVHRIILAVDIEGSTNQINSAKAQLRQAMYSLSEEALRRAGITEQDHNPMVDRGDSVLVLIRSTDEVPKSLLLEKVVPTLAALLGEYNASHPEYGFRLRVVVHAGEVRWDGKGWFGDSLDIAFRLLDANEVKKRLSRTDAPAVLVISDEIHRSVVQQGDAGTDGLTFTPVTRRVGGRTYRGWLCELAASSSLIDYHTPRDSPAMA